MIEVQKKVWKNDSLPYLDEDMMNDNQQALEKSAIVFENLRKEWETV